MPIHEYRCTNCGYQTEVLARRTDPQTIDCLQCSQVTLVRQLSNPNFSLAGSGWYKDGYENKASSAQTETSE